MTHLKLQKLQKSDYPPAHFLNVSVLLIHLFVIFAVLDVSFAVNLCINLCINYSFLHFCLHCYYISVAISGTGYVGMGTWPPQFSRCSRSQASPYQVW